MNNLSTVFVTQLPHRRDPDTQAWTPTVNLSIANEFGLVRIMMPPAASFQSTHNLLGQLDKSLKSYNLNNGDSLLLLGDCIIIAAACAVLARRGPFAVLRYDRIIKKYARIVIQNSERKRDDGPEEIGETRKGSDPRGERG